LGVSAASQDTYKSLVNAASGYSSRGAPQVAPELLTRTLRTSSRCPISLARRRHSSYLLRSPAMAMHLPGPLAESSAAVASHALASRDEM
jgi:hypothetical protein